MFSCFVPTQTTVVGNTTTRYYDLIADTHCHTNKPPSLLNITCTHTKTDEINGYWFINQSTSTGQIVDSNMNVFFYDHYNPLLERSSTVSGLTVSVSSAYSTFLTTADSYTTFYEKNKYTGCVTFENFYPDSDGNPVLSEYALYLNANFFYWRLTPYSELNSNALARFVNRNLPAPPAYSSTSLALALSRTDNAFTIPFEPLSATKNLPTTVPIPSTKLTAIFTEQGGNIQTITYAIYDVYMYTQTGKKLAAIPGLPTTTLYQSIIVLDNTDKKFFGSLLWIPGTTLNSQLNTLNSYSCSSTFTEINLIAYALAKYALAAIMYGEFNIDYLAQNFNHKFMTDLAVSRFAAFVELFESPEYDIVGFESYFN